MYSRLQPSSLIHAVIFNSPVSVVHSETYEYVTNTIIFIALIVLLIFILKIILAFGNYMNGTRKKVAAGFKLESLYKVG